MSNQSQHSVKLGTMPIGRLLLTMSLPAIFSMLVQSLYNVVDSIFVSHISEEALTAVSLAFPLQMLIIAFSLGLGIGSNSLIARRLGEKENEEASEVATTSLFLAIINSLIFMLIGLFFSKVFMSMFAETASIVSMGSIYLKIVLVFSFGIFIEITCSRILQATGNMIIPMISQLIGALTNIILDPILIFGLLGLPELGIAGAALATVIGQICAMAFALIMLSIKEHDVHISFKNFKPRMKIIVDIYKVGLPAIVMNAIASFAITALNGLLISFSKTAVAILGIYFKLQSFVFMPVFGLTQGAMPILGYNYGAKNRSRFIKTLLLSFGSALMIMLIGVSLFMFFPKQLLLPFKTTPQLEQMGVYVLRILSLNFVPAAFGIVISIMFQSIGHGFKSLLMSSLRQLILLLPLAHLLGYTLGLNAIWFAMPLSECLSLLIFAPIAYRLVHKIFPNHKEATA